MSSVWLSRTLLHLIMSELADASGASAPNPPVGAKYLLRKGVLTPHPPW